MIGPVTDYGSTMVHWMRNRKPRFQGGFHGEVERPSPSYIVDVSCQLNCSLALLVHYPSANIHWKDAATVSKAALSSGFHSRKAPALLTEQNQTSRQRGPVDPGGEKVAHRFQQRRVYLVERYRLQF